MTELQLLDVNAAAKCLSVSHWEIRALIRKQKLHPIRIGRRVLLETSELDRFVSEAKQPEPCNNA